MFRHALLREAVYQMQLPGDRARVHAHAFAALRDLSHGGPPEMPPLGPAGSASFKPHRPDAQALDLARAAAAALKTGDRDAEAMAMRNSLAGRAGHLRFSMSWLKPSRSSAGRGSPRGSHRPR
jgi:hypothetical protein